MRSLVSFGLDASLTLNGTSGNDQLKGAEANDVINGLAGNDNLMGFGSNDILDGGSDDDVLNGGNGDDLLKGGSGKDRLYGVTGNDTLAGGLDKDWLLGGVGNDRFDYHNLGDSLLSGHDVILDFDVNQDKLLVAKAPSVFTDGLTVTGLTETAISAKLTSANFVNDQYAALFKYGNRTFVAINDAIAGFQGGSDAIVELNTSKLNGVFGLGNFVVA